MQFINSNRKNWFVQNIILNLPYVKPDLLWYREYS